MEGQWRHWSLRLWCSVQQFSSAVLADKSNKEFQQGQHHNGPIGLLLSAVEKGERPTTVEVRGQGPETQCLAQLWDKLLVEEGVLKRQYEDTQCHSVRLQLVVPRSMRKKSCMSCMWGHSEDTLEKRKHSLK